MSLVDKLVVDVCPEISELSEVRIDFKCTEEGCSSIFKSTSNLEMHLIKTHGKKSSFLEKKNDNVVFRFYCPLKECKYGFVTERGDQMRYFDKFKYLKQHFLKVHKEKKFECGSCKKCFLTEKELVYHVQNECGVKFTCATCGFTYTSLSSLLMHSKRKSHPVDNLDLRSAKKQKTTSHNVSFAQDPSLGRRERPILPKSETDASVNIAAAALSELSTKVVVKGVDKAVQTSTGRRRLSVKNGIKKRASQETQTQPRISAETQTTTHYTSKKVSPGSNAANGKATRRRRKSMHTQTKPGCEPKGDNFIVSELGEEDSGRYPLEDIVLPQFCNTSSSTQTQPHDYVEIVLDVPKELELFNEGPISPPYSTEQFDRLIQQNIFYDSRLCNTQTQTETADNLDFGQDFNPILSNTETQTIQNYTIDEYSNNYTQTCDDIFLDDFVEFSDIETQTAWANLKMEAAALVSAETQTVLPFQ